MDEQKTAFLLELLISKVVSHVATADPVGFILQYRLDETTAENVMNEVGHIADEVRSGAAVTKSQAFARMSPACRPILQAGHGNRRSHALCLGCLSSLGT
jgi:hypothetical protein